MLEVIATVVTSASATPIKIKQGFTPKSISPAIITPVNKKIILPVNAANKKTTPVIAASKKLTSALTSNKIKTPVSVTTTEKRVKRKYVRKMPSAESSALKDVMGSLKRDDMKMIDDDFIVVMNKDSSDEEEEEEEEQEESRSPVVTLGTIVVAPIDGVVAPSSSSFHCEMCNEGYAQVWELEVHCATIHVSRMLKCTMCAFHTIFESRFSEHVAHAHISAPTVSAAPISKVSGCSVKLEPLDTPDVKYRSPKTPATDKVHITTSMKKGNFVIGNVHSIKDDRNIHADSSEKYRKGPTNQMAEKPRPKILGSVLGNGASSITLEDDYLGTVTVNKVDDDDDDTDDDDGSDQVTVVHRGAPAAAPNSNVVKKPRAVSMLLYCPQCPDREPFRYRKSFDNHLRQHGLDPSLMQPDADARSRKTPIKSVDKQKSPVKNVDVQVRPYVINPILAIPEEVAPVPRVTTLTNLASFSYDNDSSNDDDASSDVDSPENATQEKILTPTKSATMASKNAFQCPQCPNRAPFQYRKSFKKHMLQHAPTPPPRSSTSVKGGDFYCPSCPDRAPFHYRKSYENHLRMHVLSGESEQSVGAPKQSVERD